MLFLGFCSLGVLGKPTQFWGVLCVPGWQEENVAWQGRFILHSTHYFAYLRVV